MTAPRAEILPTLARREALLAELREGPRGKSDVVDSLDVSRSTVDRCVRELEANGLVERREGGYALSLAGQLLFEEYERFRDRAYSVCEAVGVLSALPADADLHGDALAEAEVTVADRTAPYRPAEVHLEQVRGADAVSIVSTAVSPQYVETYRDAVVEEGLELRLVTTGAVAEVLVSEYPDVLAESFETGRLEMYQLDEEPPYSLSIIERPETTRLGVLVYDEGGVRGYISSECDAAVAYGYDTFERYRERATPVGGPSSLEE